MILNGPRTRGRPRTYTPEQAKQRQREACKAYSQSERGKKNSRTTKWISRGLKFEEGQTLDEVYQRFLDTPNCELCSCAFDTGTKRCKKTKVMDHNHETGYCRAIICHSCNVSDRGKFSSSASEQSLRNAREQGIRLGVALTLTALSFLDTGTLPGSS